VVAEPIYEVKNGHRSGEKAKLLRLDQIEWPDKTIWPMVMLEFPDGEKFGYLAKDILVR
jgi:hypothetical protein